MPPGSPSEGFNVLNEAELDHMKEKHGFGIVLSESLHPLPTDPDGRTHLQMAISSLPLEKS